MALFIGSPLYAFYLRALGAKVGRGAVILSKVPVCTDLFSIGDNAVIRKDSVLTGYRADDGVIQTGPVSIGKDALVGETTVLDIGTSLGDGAQLGHSSVAARRTDRARRRALARLPRAADRRRLPAGPHGAAQHLATRRLRDRRSWRTCSCWVRRWRTSSRSLRSRRSRSSTP